MIAPPIPHPRISQYPAGYAESLRDQHRSKTSDWLVTHGLAALVSATSPLVVQLGMDDGRGLTLFSPLSWSVPDPQIMNKSYTSPSDFPHHTIIP
jgi:hypothetical protein